MIKYDYKIIRDEEDEIKEYRPNLIPKELPDLCYIKGPNSSGKSTLLNIIGVAFRGGNRKEINKSLRKKMNSIIEDKNQRIEFELNLYNKDERINITKDINTNQIISRLYMGDSNKLLSPEKLEEKYNLIYDIPEDPINRLNKLIETIKTSQLEMLSRVKDYHNFLREEFEKIKKSKNYKKISKYKDKIINIDEKKEILKNEIYEKQTEYDINSNYYYLMKYRDYLSKYKGSVKKIEKVNKEDKSKQRKKNNKISKKREKIIRYFDSSETKYLEIDDYVKKYLDKKSHELEGWKAIDIDEMRNNFIIPNRHITTLESIKEKLKEKERSVSKKKEKKYKMWNKVIEILEKSEEIESQVPGSDKTVNDFIELLKEENKGIKRIIEKNSNLIKAKEGIKEIEDNLNRLYDELKDFKLLKEKLNYKENDNIRDEYFSIDELKKDRDEFKKKYIKYKELCIKNQINVDDNSIVNIVKDNYNNYKNNEKINIRNENSSENYINTTLWELKKKNEKIKNMNKTKESLVRELDQMEKAPEHRYASKKEAIQNKIVLCAEIQSKINTYIERVDDLIEGTNLEAKNELEEEYSEFIFEYLGKKLGTIRHIDESYNVKYVDIVNEEMITYEGKKIRFSDMGTGQSQSAYLMGKLNSLDNRKAIALIDEVAMMDTKSIAPILNKIKNLYIEGKLIAGIIVQRSDNMIIEEI